MNRQSSIPSPPENGRTLSREKSEGEDAPGLIPLGGFLPMFPQATRLSSDTSDGGAVLPRNVMPMAPMRSLSSVVPPYTAAPGIEPLDGVDLRSSSLGGVSRADSGGSLGLYRDTSEAVLPSAPFVPDGAARVGSMTERMNAHRNRMLSGGNLTDTSDKLSGLAAVADSIRTEGMVFPAQPVPAAPAVARHRSTASSSASRRMPGLARTPRGRPEEDDEGDGEYECKDCLSKFRVRESLRAHRRKWHRRRKAEVRTSAHECDFPRCGKSYSALQDLRDHQIVEHYDKRFHCPFCDESKTFTSRANRRRHFKKVHGYNVNQAKQAAAERNLSLDPY